MKTSTLLFWTALALPFPALACPTGMVFNGDGCSPPYEYTGWDWLEDQYEAIESIGADRPTSYAPGLTREEADALQRRTLEAQQEKERVLKELAEGVWHVASTPTPEGNLCAATFAKYARGKDGVEGGVVTVMGFQQPKPEAWLMFQGTKLPKPRDVKKIKITLQQDDEPAQSVQVFNYRESSTVGTVAFAVPGLMAALDGMRDTQSFKLSIGRETVLAVQWASAAPIIKQLAQCAK